MNQNEKHIIDFFKTVGIYPEKIPVSSEKTPDFLIKHKEDNILIELKTKLDSDELIKKRENDFKKGETHEYITSISRDNPISNKIKKAYKQLKAQKKRYDADFCFIILLSAGYSKHTQFLKIETTLFGKKYIHPADEDSTIEGKEYFYFTNSDFNKYKDIIDGAFIIADQYCKLCINSLSANYPDFIKSDFVKTFHPYVIDPLVLEGKGEAFIVEGGVDRSDEHSVKKYICEKYGLKKIIAVDFPEYNYFFQINLKELKEGLY